MTNSDFSSGLTPEQEQAILDRGLDPADFELVLSGPESADVRPKPFDTFEDALNYQDEDFPLWTFSDILYDVNDDLYYVSIPEESP